ncbi:MAG: DUF1549 domain-containing protein, partial [Pirellulaceae bacterium]|nr:DUF1549 domain-containing protein [Pirellulaceae bacterium]
MMTTPSLQRCIGSIIVLLLFCATARGQQDSGQQDSGRQDKRDAAAAQFDREIAPLMASYCLDCHRGVKPEGGLDLSRGASASRGGESGPAIDAKDPLNSLLWRRIVDGEMPPKEKLPDADRDKLKQWIGAGAKWGTEVIDPFQYTTSKRAGFDWWALQPLSKPEPPVVKAQDQVANPIDAFLLTKLEAAQLSYSPQAAPRVLVRRLHFDLIGLPPTPEVVAAFEKDPSEAAYQQLIADLLASPDYGERWGRHWLDVARFGESDGFERNNPRENLWRYRDWVIAALNQDMPYDEFVRQQIAGDLLNPGDADGVAAVGFLVSGVHNTVVGSSEFMRRLAREDELEEVIGAVAQTFIGLTVNCARCHDHKFDPIPQVEFYRITAAIDGVAHGEREVVRAVDQKRLDQLNADIARLNEQIDAVESTARQDVLAARKDGKAKPAPAPRPLAHWDFESDFRDRAGSLHGKPVAGAKIENGALLVDGKTFVETAPLEKKLVEKTLEATVLLSNLTQRGGSAISVETTNGVVFDAIVFGEREVTKWMAGSNGFVRTDSFQGPEEKEAKAKPVHFAIVYSADGTITGY